jgi:hypothetical protein
MIRLAPLFFIVLFGCGTPANPPSLLPRAIETRPDTVQTTAPLPAAGSLDPVIASRLDALVAEAKAGDADFVKTDRSGGAALTAGQGAASGSEAWVAAELIRSALQVARQRSAGALAEIDAIAVKLGQQAASDPTIGGLADVETAQADVEAIVARQTARLETVSR